MTQYTARNGVEVITLENVLGFQLPMRGVSTFGINHEKVEALREFFQHERDEELGRWRWPENPDYVVYPKGNEASVIDEAHGVWGQWSRLHAASDSGRDALASAAHAYFEAHPERKPWYEAKPGDAWLVSLPEGERVMLVDPSQFTDGNEGIDFDDPDITAARRIWPEDAS